MDASVKFNTHALSGLNMVLTDGVHGPSLAPTEMLLLNVGIISVCYALLCKPSLGDKKGIITLTIFTLVAAASRVVLEPFPNVQPLTVMCLLMGACLGARRGMAFAVMATMLSNIILSHGYWTIFQASGWAFIAFIGSKINIVYNNELAMKKLIISSAFLSVLFDWWVSLSVYHFGMSSTEFLIYLLNGIPFDIMHAMASIFTAVWFAPAIVKLLQDYSTPDLQENSVGEADVIIA